jgi:hypothetical protein
VVAPTAGGYIVWGEAGDDLAEDEIGPAFGYTGSATGTGAYLEDLLADAAAAILVTPANKLATSATGEASANVTYLKDVALTETGAGYLAAAFKKFFDVATPVGTVNAVLLAATGLDSVSTTAPAGVASNFREMLVQVWRRQFKKSTLTASELKTYADNGTSILTTQVVSDDGTTQTLGASS